MRAPQLTETRPWLFYVLPMGVFLALTAAEGMAVLQPYFVGLYGVKAALVTVALAWCSRAWRVDLHVDFRAACQGALAGLVGFGAWIALERITPGLPFLATRTAFDPYTQILDPGLRSAFLIVRLFGLALMVPLMEEIFWRGFLLRFVTDPDHWKERSLDAFSWKAAASVGVAFAAVHARTEWLAAFVFAGWMAWLLRRTRNLFACVLAHAIANLALGIFVLATGQWKYW